MSQEAMSVSISAETRRRLEARAAARGEAPGRLAGRLLESALVAEDAKRAAIEEALAEAKEGRWVSREAVHAWMDSWGGADELPMPEPDIDERPSQR